MSTLTDDEHETPRGKALRETLSEGLIAVAQRNKKHRFYIPSVDNNFDGIQYDFVMIDSGSNTLLLPFPSTTDGLLAKYDDSVFCWDIQYSSGTGAVPSPTLIISRIDGDVVGDIYLCGRKVHSTFFLRFHLGSESAQKLIDCGRLDDFDRKQLTAFLARLDGESFPERCHVLLGQSVLSNFFILQAGKMMLIAKKGYFPVREDLITAWNLIKTFQKPAGFDDLVDEAYADDWAFPSDDETLDPSFFMEG